MQQVLWKRSCNSRLAGGSTNVIHALSRTETAVHKYTHCILHCSIYYYAGWFYLGLFPSCKRALVSQLQSDVENLKIELASTKTALQESNVQALTEEMLEVKASMALLLKEGNRSTTSSGPVAGRVREKGAVSSNCKQPWNVVVGRSKGTNGKGGSGTHMPSKNSGSKHDSHASAQSHKNAASGGDNIKKEVYIEHLQIPPFKQSTVGVM